MADIVNDFFRKHYPVDFDTAWKMAWCGSTCGREYIGDKAANSTIFPGMVCADGFTMSVQGHFGAYSYPREDFADKYCQVEIMCLREEILEELGRGYDVGDERIYPYVDIPKVIEVIEKHGGLAITPPQRSTQEK